MFSQEESSLSLFSAAKEKSEREWRKFEAFSDVISRARFVYHATETTQEYDSDRAISYSRSSFGVRRRAGSSTKNLLESRLASSFLFETHSLRSLDTSANAEKREDFKEERRREDDSTTNPTPTSTKYSFLSRRFVLHFFETRNA